MEWAQQFERYDAAFWLAYDVQEKLLDQKIKKRLDKEFRVRNKLEVYKNKEFSKEEIE